MPKRIEAGFERVLFASRWLLAPMYLGLVAALGMLVIVFLRQTLYYVPQALDLTSEGAILATLALIDLVLAGNLLVIVILSGYESTVSRIEVGDESERPAWMGSVDFAGLKMKLIASIVAISAVDLLKRFMEIGRPGVERTTTDTDLAWLAGLHLVFVASGLLMAIMDWFSARSGRKGGP